METEFLISLVQIGVAILLVLFVLLQQRGTAMGSAFGGESSFYGMRRGAQKYLYQGTIVLGALFIALALVRLIFTV